jgi:hypothetical protein
MGIADPFFVTYHHACTHAVQSPYLADITIYSSAIWRLHTMRHAGRQDIPHGHTDVWQENHIQGDRPMDFCQKLNFEAIYQYQMKMNLHNPLLANDILG